MRDPLALARRTGVKGLLSFQLFVGGGVLFALANPLLWVMFILGLTRHGPAAAIFPGASLLASNILLTYLAMIGPRRRGWGELSPYGLTVIFYWAMVSVAGYRGLWQLATRPFFWEKTTHGLAASCRTPGR